MSDKCSTKSAHFYVQHGMQLYILIIQKSSVIFMWQNWCVSSIFVRHGHYWRKIVRQCCTVYMCTCSACFGWVESLRKWVGSGWVQHFGPMSISESSSAVTTGCTVSMPASFSISFASTTTRRSATARSQTDCVTRYNSRNLVKCCTTAGTSCTTNLQQSNNWS